MQWLLDSFKHKPLRSVLILAFSLRVLASFFAPGYLMHDDHFLVVEAAASWADGEDYNAWLPWNMGEVKKPHPANFAYVGTQYIYFEVIKWLGVDDPKIKMLILRLLHGLYSLLIVWFGYKITEKISTKKNALIVGLLLAAMAIMPNFSVRQLVEFSCIPPLLFASWILIKNEGYWKTSHFILAGIGIGLATGFRFQCGVFGIGFGLALLVMRQWKAAIILGVASLFFFAMAQIQDVFIWGEPFKQLRAYIEYNDQNAGNYPNGPFYQYLLTLIGFLIPPVSIFLLFGYFREGRRFWLLFLPSLAFFVFHSAFPNKQERFIFPFIPYLVILGVIGWNRFVEGSSFWTKRKKLLHFSYGFFLVLNTLGLVVLGFTYGKKARVGAMYHLYEQDDFQNFMAVFVESSAMPPTFYTGSWPNYYYFKPGETQMDSQNRWMCNRQETRKMPNYLLFYGFEKNKEVAATFEKAYPSMEFQTTIEPGMLDKVVHWLNPINSLEYVDIYRIDTEDICSYETRKLNNEVP